MGRAAEQTMTPEEFFLWQRNRDELYELVDGVPVMMLKMMTGASLQHDRVVVNVIASLHGQLRGSRCRPTTDDVALRTKIRTIRRPDVTVECAPLIRDTYECREPRLVVEVFSPSTMDVDRVRKVEEYKHHPTIDAILLIDTRRPDITLYRRSEGTWTEEAYDRLDAVISLPAIEAALSLADIYEDVAFDE